MKLGAYTFGEEHKGETAIIQRVPYVLKSASAAWRDHFANAIVDELQYKPCQADNDVYLKAKKKSDEINYYLYIVVYVDGILIVDERPEDVINVIEWNSTRP